MRHYFLDSQKTQADYFSFKEVFLNNSYTFYSSNDVFSKEHIDEGTKVLLKTIIDNYKSLDGNVLDLGCGYGVVGIVLKKHYKNIFVTFVDINNTAVELTQKNSVANGVDNYQVIQSNITQSVDRPYDYVFSNPPIKAGKDVLFGFVTETYNVLKQGGELVLVIRKDKGQESLQKHMNIIFGNASVINRDKGYYIIKSVK